MEGKSSDIVWEGQYHITHLLEPLSRRINEKDLHVLACKFVQTFTRLAKTSTDHFLTTPVTTLPTGHERGKFIAIDVGGTNLRVGLVELLGEDGAVPSGMAALIDTVPLPKIRRSHEKSWPIENHLKMDQAEDLFTWIGDCIAEVVEEAIVGLSGVELDEHVLGDEIPLGITFSFPMTQTSMSEATLMPMGKGFAITSDLNLGKMLLGGYARHCEDTATNGSSSHDKDGHSNKKRRVTKLPGLRIAAIANDTVATFASLAYTTKASPNSHAVMGLIVGTGTNATVPMRPTTLHSSKAKSLHLPVGSDSDNAKVVINTEWSIRGTDVPLRELGIMTTWDIQLDKNSEAPGFQPFEYMTAGRYIGEIVRLILVEHLSNVKATGDIPPQFLDKNAVTTTFLATEVAPSDKTLSNLRDKLNEMFPAPSDSESPYWTDQLADDLRFIAQKVQVRSCALIAAAIVGLLACVGEIRMDNPEGAYLDKHRTLQPPFNSEGPTGTSTGCVEELVVPYTGSTIQWYPEFLETCQAWIDNLVKHGSVKNENKRVVLREATDGGIIGAAVLAGMAGTIV
ncbi:actin-like ATPase domain-containing protein [Patellaria atrata CBS 101060]|uniref:Phosphotransferase n=1 Tax=Patellaria atrata CBS 101060 TaxID=1346257 RepID=A0A9P4SAB3_9PEZI|nr:actin-like ATPase domain-containing protein [Patellaria atrata CBS 101060]